MKIPFAYDEDADTYGRHSARPDHPAGLRMTGTHGYSVIISWNDVLEVCGGLEGRRRGT